MRMVEAGATEKVHGGGVGWGYDWEGEEEKRKDLT